MRKKANRALVLGMALVTGCPGISGRESPDAGTLERSDGLIAGASRPPVALREPTDGAHGVPTNLVRIVIASETDPGPAQLRAADGREVQLVKQDEIVLGCDAAWCGTWALGARLASLASYEVVLGENRFAFETAAVADTRPPLLLEPTLEIESKCVIAKLAADEPVAAVLVDGRGQILARHDVSAREHTLAGSGAEGEVVHAIISDLAGNLTRKEWPYHSPSVPDLVITEVLANPLGPEPAQEWVEIRNQESQSTTTRGLVIATATGVDALPSKMIEPGAYALIVGANFRSSDGLDVPVAPEVPLVRLQGPTIGAGLRNGMGGTVELRTRTGAIISRYGGHLDLGAPSVAGSSAGRIDETGCDVRSNWIITHPTPGRSNSELPPLNK